jgi:hypothetical protein
MSETTKALDVAAIERAAYDLAPIGAAPRLDRAQELGRIATLCSGTFALCARVRELEATLGEVVSTNDALEEDDSPEAFFNREAALVHARVALAPSQPEAANG